VRSTPSLLAAVAIFGAALSPAWAADGPDAPHQELNRVQEELDRSRERKQALEKKAAKLAREMDSLRKKLVAVARQAQDTEDELTALEARLAELQAREKALHGELSSRDAQMVKVLTGLERLALRPPEAILVQPGSTEDTVRSAILLRAAVPGLMERAEELRGELARLAAVRADIDARKRDIASAAARLDQQRGKLAELVARQKSLMQTTEAERRTAARRAAALAKDAKTLQDLLAKLERERQRRAAERARRLAALATAKPAIVTAPTPAQKPDRKPDQTPAAPARNAAPQQAAVPPAGNLEEVRGTMPMPVRGELVRRYGAPTEVGVVSKGIVLRTRPGAQVVAPADGTVAFAGPFRGYGRLLIMEHGGGYHTLLSGMGRIDAVVGQRLLTGEPVGVMEPSGRPSLYVELRRDGRPINPLPWLTARKG